MRKLTTGLAMGLFVLAALGGVVVAQEAKGKSLQLESDTRCS